MDKFWSEHAYLLYICTIALFGFVGYLLKRIVDQGTNSMKSVCDSISDLYEKYNVLDRRLSELHGAHDAIMEHTPNSHHGRRLKDPMQGGV